MSAAAKIQKTFNISLVVNVKRGKEEIEFAKSETANLHNLIATSVESDWAKSRIEAIHSMIFAISGDQIKSDLQKSIAEVDPEDTDTVN